MSALGHYGTVSVPATVPRLSPATVPEGAAVTVPKGTVDTIEGTARSDEALARSAALGDRFAFAELARRHGPALFRYAARMLTGQHHAAEDALQEALVKAWLALPDFRGDASVRTWLFRLVANECATSRRRRRPQPVDDGLLEMMPGRDGYRPDSAAVAADLRAALEDALDELPWRQRASWMLREVEGLSYAEIAEVLGVGPAVVRGQLHRARSTLAVRMEQWR